MIKIHELCTTCLPGLQNFIVILKILLSEHLFRERMELVGEWFLIHRTAEQLLDICQNSGLDYSKIEIESEPQGINLFCTIQK